MAQKLRIAGWVLFIIIIAVPAGAAPTMAFGYLANRSENPNYDYLETIFPNSFASSILNLFQVNVITPVRVDRLLERHGLSLERQYPPHELYDLTKRISADYFVDGSFTLLQGNRIRITIRLYRRGTNRIFSFTNTGTMETEIFRLVDRITAIMVSFLGRNNLYIAGTIPRGSRIGIITNLDGADLNALYHSFLTGGYRVASIQGNFLRGGLPPGGIDRFKYVSGLESYYDIVSDPRPPRFLHGTWSGPTYQETVTRIIEARRHYDWDYRVLRDDALKKLTDYHGIDTLLIVAFNGSRRSAWVRSIDVRTGELLWIESGISGDITGICAGIIDRMTTIIERR